MYVCTLKMCSEKTKYAKIFCLNLDTSLLCFGGIRQMTCQDWHASFIEMMMTFLVDSSSLLL